MRGKVLAPPEGASNGLISGDDGQRYEFRFDQARNGPPRAGQDVDFKVVSGMATAIYITGTPALAISDAESWLNFYFNPTGRVSRRAYWLYGFLVLFVVSIVLGWIPIVGQLVTLVTAWAGIALSWKRCHDVGRSGWWTFLPVAPLLAMIVTLVRDLANGSSGGGLVILGLVTFACYMWMFFAIYVRRGDPGPNRFGPAPRGDMA
jgi:uncharacterized membrane protein YhaH (DUF805 family)